MKKKPNARAEMPRNLIFPRAELVYLPVTPEVARAVENAVQMSLDAPLNAPNPRRKRRPDAPSCTRAACRFPGVEGLNRGIRAIGGAGDKRRAADKGSDVRHGGIIPKTRETPGSRRCPLLRSRPSGLVLTKAPSETGRGEKGSADENLRHINVTVRVVDDTKPDLLPSAGENVAAVSVRGNERGVRFFRGGMVGNVLARAREGIAERFQHVADMTVGGGLVRKVMVVTHVGGFDARNAGKLRVERQRRKSCAIRS